MITENADKCRALLFSVVRQALIDHRAAIRASQHELPEYRRSKKLPHPTRSEILAHALQKEPALWIRSAERGEMSFEWCCEQVGIDPDWIRLRMNSNELLGRLSDVCK